MNPDPQSQINEGIQFLRHEVTELRKEIAEFKLETSGRLTTMEVGVGILRWLFTISLALITIGATVASIIVGYLTGVGG